ncbi:hypothetical protein F7R12_13935 [Pseudomonas tolaasii]|nr:hypothetical protein F7R12_13935 [Pseudomonas tolaasii]
MGDCALTQLLTGVVSEVFAVVCSRLTALCELAVNIGAEREYSLCFLHSLQASCHLRLLQS